MNIFISTNPYTSLNLELVFEILNRVNDKNVGVEIFPLWQDENFSSALKRNFERFKAVPVSFHGPYYLSEASTKKGTAEHARCFDYYKKTFEIASELCSKYIVFHHNNCAVNPAMRDEMIKISTENLFELNLLAKQAGVKIVVENSGVIPAGNVLFNETEFISLFSQLPDNDFLIDIGHAHCNGWDLHNVISLLSDRIVAYHVHNNYGTADNHNRLYDGTLDVDGFFTNYRIYTPKADIVVEYSKEFGMEFDGIADDIMRIKYGM